MPVGQDIIIVMDDVIAIELEYIKRAVGMVCKKGKVGNSDVVSVCCG